MGLDPNVNPRYVVTLLDVSGGPIVGTSNSTIHLDC